MPTIQRPVSLSGVLTPYQRPANPDRRLGAATVGQLAADQPGSPARSILPSTSFIGEPEILDLIGMATSGRAITSIHAHCLPWMPTPERSNGIFNLLRTMSTTGTRLRSPYCSMQRSTAG